ncbi:cytochrome ubiquinol oxidase subunit I [bacterium]|nr:cytochrome ubiquinol oxidase subunit I [bacterium]
MDAVLLARWQFALTIGFHFIFPPISIGLAWLLVITEYRGWKKGDEYYLNISKLFSKLLALLFAMGVATGIVMEFQFGTNWAEYSKFVGDIFGAPLAAEGMFAFFLESSFLGLYLFGRNKVSKGVHWFSILLVAIGATISAFWILVANSWQQTPAGYIIQNGRAELTDFSQAVFNPSTLPRFFHTMDAALTAGAFFMAGISAYILLKNPKITAAQKSLKLSLIFGFIVSLLNLFPFGHEHTKQVHHTQPVKFAALEGLYKSQEGAPLVLFALVDEETPELKAEIKIPKLLSWMALGDADAKLIGLNEFPQDEIPPLWLTFVSYHNMVALGMFFIAMTGLGVLLLITKKIWSAKWYQKLLIMCIPLPVAACQFGWVAAEVGRQPWIVYGLLKTKDAVSVSVSAGEILFSMILLGLIYLFIMTIWLYISVKKVNKFVFDNSSGGK